LPPRIHHQRLMPMPRGVGPQPLEPDGPVRAGRGSVAWSWSGILAPWIRRRPWIVTVQGRLLRSALRGGRVPAAVAL